MRKRSTLVPFTLFLGIAALGMSGCAPAAMDNSSAGGQGGSSSGTGGSGGRGGSGGSSSGTGGSSSGTGGSSSGTGGSSGGTGGSSSGTGGSSSGTGGTGGSSGSGGTGGSGGSTGGSGGSTGGSGGTGGSAGSGGSTGGGGDARKPEAGGAEAGTGAVTFKKLFSDIFLPTCGGPTGRCHQVVRDNYFLFNMGDEMRSYMLLVPNAPANGTIPQRVMTLLTYVSPTTPGNLATVRMPPQSGANLGNPQIKRMPLTTEQIAQIRTWAMTGAKFE